MQCQYLLRPGCQPLFLKKMKMNFSQIEIRIFEMVGNEKYEMIFIKVLLQTLYTCLWIVTNSALLSYSLITYFSERNCFQNVIANTQFIFDPLVIKLTFVFRKENRDVVYLDKCLLSSYCLCKTYLIVNILGDLLFITICYNSEHKPMTQIGKSPR